jgi:hypothetical protein
MYIGLGYLSPQVMDRRSITWVRRGPARRARPHPARAGPSAQRPSAPERARADAVRATEPTKAEPSRFRPVMKAGLPTDLRRLQGFWSGRLLGFFSGGAARFGPQRPTTTRAPPHRRLEAQPRARYELHPAATSASASGTPPAPRAQAREHLEHGVVGHPRSIYPASSAGLLDVQRALNLGPPCASVQRRVETSLLQGRRR